MSLSLRYSNQLHGAITFTGNTLMLSQDTDLHQPGVQGSGGTFITRNLLSQVGAYPPGTTLNYLENGSEAQLVLPPGSTVVRAELVWGGIYAYSYLFPQLGEVASAQDISALINNPVLLNGQPVFPDLATAHTEGFTAPTGNSISWYARSADVTSIVQSIGAGTYYTEQVPALIQPISNYTSRTEHAGWTLAIVYENPIEDFRNVYLWNGGELISGLAGPTADINISGFETLPSGTVDAKLFLSAQEGDGDIQGDSVYFGPNVGILSQLSGPNNALTNFFGGQINKSDGTIDTTGTFGTMNNNVFTNTNYFGGRHGWDITAINVTPQMQNSQTSAVIRIATVGDAYMVNTIGLMTDAIDIDVPVVKLVDKAYATIGDTLVYSFTVTNNSNVDINTIQFTDAIPNGTTFVGGSVVVNGTPQGGYNPATGFALPNMLIGDVVTISYSVTVTSVPIPNPILNTAGITFAYGGISPSSSTSNTVNTTVNTAIINSVKSVSAAYAKPGDTLTYSTVLTNNGTVDAINIVFTDSIPSGTTLVPNSVTVNAIPVLGADPSVGVTVPTILAGGNTIVTFQVVIGNSLPTPNPIPNNNQTAYQYVLDPAQAPVTATPTTSNTVTTQVNEAKLSLVKAVDKATTVLGDTLIYTTTISNTGNVAATNVTFTDLVPVGTTFVLGSVIVAGVPQPLENPTTGIVIPSIAAGGNITVSFQVLVGNSLPVPNPIPNNNGAAYQYQVDPAQPAINATPVVSNTVTTQINDVIISAVKSVDKAYADIGDTIVYTVVVSNAGNIVATNVNFQDNIPAGTTFALNSVTFAGVPQVGLDPQAGFILPSIPAAGSIVVTFSVVVNSILPLPATVDNTATITPPGKPPVPTNPVTTSVNHAQLSTAKQVDVAYATTGQIITYTSIITNNGTTIATDVIFTDSIPGGTTLVPNSVTVNGSPVPGADPSVGVAVADILAGNFATVVFKALVGNTIPVPNPILNTSSTDYSYLVDPTLPPVTAPTDTSNQVSTQVNLASLVIVKAVDKATAGFGEILTYTTTINNTGNADAINVNFQDNAPAGTTFIPGTVIVGGNPQPLADPSAGILIPLIVAGGSITVVFQVLVGNSFPPQNPIPNNNGASYQYVVDPAEPPINTIPAISNTALTQINDVIISAVKTVDKVYADVGDTIVYTVVVSNAGNIAATNVNFQDNIPTGTTFVPNSVTFAGLPQAGLDPQAGFILPSIPSLDDIVVTFTVTVDSTFPLPSAVENIATITPPGKPPVPTDPVTTIINHAQLSVAKQVDVAYATTGQVITYTSVITNLGTAIATDVIFTDGIPVGTTFVPNSVIINGVPTLGVDPSFGIPVPDIAIGGLATVIFKVQVGNSLPVPNPITNTADVDYSYLVDPANPPVIGPTNTSNQVTTQVNLASLVQTKTVDKVYATIGDTLVYSVTVQNTGNVAADNVNFFDLIPVGTAFVPNSVTVAGSPVLGADPSVGFTLGSINAGASIVVTFSVQVTSAIPVPNPIPNVSTASFNYLVDPSAPPINGTLSQSNQVLTDVQTAELRATKQTSAPVVYLGDTYTYTIEVTNFGNANAINSILTDLVPVGTTFVAGTVIIDGNPEILADPTIGITLPTIIPAQTMLISFDVQVGALIPTPNPMPNIATINYEYVVDPANPLATNSTTTNNVNVLAIDKGDFASFNVVKSVSTNYALIGDTITYTVNLTNTGIIDSLNTILNDVVPNGTTFVAGTVIIDGTPAPLENPASGINIGTVAVAQTVVVTFQVKIGAIVPVPNPIPNQASVDYQFRNNPNLPPIDGPTTVSNIVNTFVKKVSIAAVKAVDLSYSTLDGILTYTVGVANTGTTPLINLLVTDLAPSGTTFVPGSVIIGGIPDPLANIQTGVTIGSLAPSQIIPIIFKVQIDSTFPAPNPVVNNANVEYQYFLDPTAPAITGTPVTTNNVSTLVNKAIIELEKSVDVAYVDLLGIITYTVNVKNTGNVDALNVVVQDTIPSGTTFITGSVLVNGVPKPLENIVPGINVPLVALGQTIPVIFSVRVGSSIPVPNPLPNTAIAPYQYKVDPAGPTQSDISAPSNTVTTLVNHGEITVVKSVDKAFADTNEELTYTFTITSTGNVPSNNVTLTDLAPSGTTFVPGSVLVDGLPNIGANPITGINIGTVSNVPRTVSLKVLVGSTIPAPNPIPNTASVDYEYIVDPANPPVSANLTTNEVQTFINHALIVAQKYANKAYAAVNGTINYTIAVQNIGSTSAINVLVKDLAPSGTTFIPGSVIVGGVPDALANIETGVTIPSIAVNQIVLVSFSVKVGSTIPVSNPVVNNASVDYEYVVTPGQPPVTAPTTTTNDVSTLVNKAIIELDKSVDLSFVDLQGIITYTINVKNTGNVDALNVVVQDMIPSGTTFVSGSVFVNGVSKPLENPVLGINVPLVIIGQTIPVKFSVKVGNSIPVPNPIPNTALAQYEYKVEPTGPNQSDISLPSNTVTTRVNHGEITVVKSVDKEFADTNEELTYTFTITSIGSVPSDNVTLTDLAPSGTTFVPGSVLVDGLPNAGDPTTGINIGTVSNTLRTVSFKVLVGSTIPVPNPIPNTASVGYEYTVDPVNPPVPANLTTNEVKTLIKHAQIVAQKYVDKAYTGIDGVITYTTILSNTGSADAINVMFTDTLALGISFVAGTVIVDGIADALANPELGITIPLIAQNDAIPVTFKVKVDGVVPVPNPILNNNTTEYEYVVIPGTQAVTAVPTKSNIVETLVNDASIKSTKSVDKAFATLGDIIEYTVTLENTGNVTAQDVIFKDNIPLGTSFVVGSFYVDGTLIDPVDIVNGVSIVDIPAGDIVTIKFNVKVQDTTLPIPNPITNSAQATFNFLIDPNGVAVPGIPSVTNDVSTQINVAILNIEKIANKNFADIGEVISYTFNITNTGNVAANNILFKDVLQAETTFVAGSVLVGGLPFPAYNPVTGFNIPSIAAGGIQTVKFDVTVVSIPANNIVYNTAIADYTHIVDPTKPEVPKTTTSNTTNVPIRHGEILPSGLVKSADTSIVTEGDIINYKIEVTNSGNVAINNVVISDALPVGTAFINGTVFVDGVAKPLDNPTTGIKVGTINQDTKSIVLFKVKVLDGAPKELKNTAVANYNYVVDPLNPPVQKQTTSNEVIVKNVSPVVTIVKSSDLQIVTNGDIVTYKLVVTNTGELGVYDVIIKDLLEPDIDFVEGSVEVNGVSLPNANVLAGFSIGALDTTEQRIVTFKAKVLDKTDGFIDNISTAVYKYKLSSTDVERIKSVNSNLNRIIQEEHKLEISKIADKTVASLNDIITYKVKIINTGDTIATNIVFKDTLPDSVEFVENSLTVNGVTVNDVNLIDGVNIGSLKAGEQVVIIYKAKVISGSANGYSENSAYAKYDYELSNRATGSDTTEIVSVKVEINIDSFKQMSIDEEFKIPVQKPNMEEIDSVNAIVVIEDSYIVKVPRIISNEGQILNGNKLIVHGYIETSVEYTATVRDQAMHSAHYKIAFSTFIMLPNNYKDGQLVEVSNIMEDVDYTMIDKRTFAVSLMLLLIAKIK